eukprot:7960858-Alexandrium_andersonii.AAC.1
MATGCLGHGPAQWTSCAPAGRLRAVSGEAGAGRVGPHLADPRGLRGRAYLPLPDPAGLACGV